MKIFTKNSFAFKMIISLLVAIILFNFIVFNEVRATDDSKYGVLFRPVNDLVIAVGDAIMTAANLAVGSKDVSTIKSVLFFEKDSTNLGAGIYAVVGGAVCVASFVFLPKAVAIGITKGVATLGIGGYIAKKTGLVGGLPDRLDIPAFFVSPEKIFENGIPLLDINIINPVYEDSVVSSIQPTIANWYKTFRNIAIVAMLSVLVYIAIRIIISSSADDKAKYKLLIKDWLIGFFLIFFMHYIMTFITYASETIVYVLAQEDQIVVMPEQEYTYDKIVARYCGNIVIEDGAGHDVKSATLAAYKNYRFVNADDVKKRKELSNSDIGKLKLSFSEYIRFKAQVTTNGEQDDTERMTYGIMYIVLAAYTFMFFFIYAKRLIYVIFLTMMAPLIAITYPLDKLKDGSAQGFNTWLKEYIFNMAIQPLHLFLYTILVKMAFSFTVDHPIYALVILGSLLQVENIIREMFGLNKTKSSQGLFKGAVGGAALMGLFKGGAKGLVGLMGKGGKGPGGGGGAPTDKIHTATTPDNRKPDEEFKDFEADASMLDRNDNINVAGGGNLNSVVDGSGSTEEQTKQRRREELEAQLAEFDDKAALADGGALSYEDQLKYMDAQEELKSLSKMQEEQQAQAEEQDQIRMMDEKDEAWENLKYMNETAGRTYGAADYIANTKWARALAKSKLGQDFAKLTGSKFFKGAVALGGRYVFTKKNAERLKTLAKLAGGATLATAGGIVGAGFGIATDDAKNIGTYTLAGLGVGGALGSSATGFAVNTGGKAINAVGGEVKEVLNGNGKIQEMKETVAQATKSKEEYQKMVNEKADREFMLNEEAKKQYKEKFGEEYKEAMRAALQYRKHGILDNNIIIKAMKAKPKSTRVSKNWADQRRIYAARLAKYVNSEKNVREIGDQLKAKNVTQAEIEEQQYMIRQIKDLYS